jgi:hypothetical protein
MECREIIQSYPPIKKVKENSFQNVNDMIFSNKKIKINQKENLENILKFQEESGYILPPSYLYILVNFGPMEYDRHNWLYFTDKSNIYYDGILLFGIPNIESLKIWLENLKKNVTGNIVNRNNDFLPMISTSAPSTHFYVGIKESNLDKIFLYDDDYENFEPILVANNIFDFFKNRVTTNYV